MRSNWELQVTHDCVGNELVLGQLYDNTSMRAMVTHQKIVRMLQYA